MSPRTAVIVPTVGRSPWLVDCLEALRADGGDALEIVLVVPAGVEDVAIEPALKLANRVLRLSHPAGFAAANNAALAEIDAELVALVNDDAVVGPGWHAALTEVLAANLEAAAAQGVNVEMADPARVDGAGMAWNGWWQAIQLGRGEPPPAGPEPRQVFGVSATAALYRRAALVEIALSDATIFDARLESYYEDVDLACRLRATGWTSWVVPHAHARHAGSTSGSVQRLGSWPLIYGNRWLVLARHLGRGFWPRLPWILLRDVLDLARSLLRGEPGRAVAVVLGWGRAARRLGGFVHFRRTFGGPSSQ